MFKERNLNKSSEIKLSVIVFVCTNRRPTGWSTAPIWRTASSVCGGGTLPPWCESSHMLPSSSVHTSSTRGCWEATMAFRGSKCQFVLVDLLLRCGLYLDVLFSWKWKMWKADIHAIVFLCVPELCLQFKGYWLGLWLVPQPPCWPILWTWCELGWL